MKRIKNFLFKDLSFRWQVIPIAVLALSDLAIFAFPSYLSNFLPNLQHDMQITDYQLSLVRSIYGIVNIVLYVFAMSFADKFKCKTLILIGVFGMFVIGVWYSLVPIIWPNPNPHDYVYSTAFWNYLLIFIAMGVFSVLFFWSPLWKLVAMQGKKEQVGTMNGLEGSINGFLGALIAVIGTIFLFINPQVGHIHIGFLVLTSCYSVSLLISFIFVIKYVREDEVKTKSKLNLWNNFKACFKNAASPKLWLYSISVMGIYMYQMALSGYTDYMKNVFLFSSIVVFILGLSKTYLMRFVSSFVMGRFADKKNHYILYITWGLVISTTLTLLVIILPGFYNNFRDHSQAWYFIPIQILAGLNMICLGFAAWCLVTIRWSAIATELKINEQQYSGAVAFISFIAFLPDAFFQAVKSAIQSHHQVLYPSIGYATDQLGNQLIMLFSIAVGLVGLLASFLLWYWIYKLPTDGKINKHITKVQNQMLNINTNSPQDPKEYKIKINQFIFTYIYRRYILRWKNIIDLRILIYLRSILLLKVSLLRVQ
ncbi:MFS transporter [Mycoplasma sp. SG1]|uniref:MFS transporter n=1 Tax=Mycoplasma sp. SG1 TaxID=2810348 RepID=UPI002024DE97|nr:MFS transporter [Mycoplasma sp. SG1]URM52785.1 MFS transporter [Mycoplasma sp. SG1]